MVERVTENGGYLCFYWWEGGRALHGHCRVSFAFVFFVRIQWPSCNGTGLLGRTVVSFTILLSSPIIKRVFTIA